MTEPILWSSTSNRAEEGGKRRRNNVDEGEGGGDGDLVDAEVGEGEVDVADGREEEVGELRRGFEEVVADGDSGDLGAREVRDDVRVEPPQRVGTVGGERG